MFIASLFKTTKAQTYTGSIAFDIVSDLLKTGATYHFCICSKRLSHIRPCFYSFIDEKGALCIVPMLKITLVYLLEEKKALKLHHSKKHCLNFQSHYWIPIIKHWYDSMSFWCWQTFTLKVKKCTYFSAEFWWLYLKIAL